MSEDREVVVEIPVHTISKTNERGHWRARAARTKLERDATRVLLKRWIRAIDPSERVTVTLTRVGMALDDDNLRGALKAVRDEIADLLGLPNDRDPRVRWQYDQIRGGRISFVRVRISLLGGPR